MKKISILFILLAGVSFSSLAQDISLDDLMSDIETEEETVFLPEKMLFTQRAFWGEKGLYRRIGFAPKVLTAETREKELRARRTMFKIHQATGILTAAGMALQGYLGSKLHQGDYSVLNFHEKTAAGINIAYFTTALMALTAPPPMVNRKKFDNIKLHKYLAMVHLSGMIVTNVLAHKVDDNPNLVKYHKIAGITTFAAYTSAIVSIKLDF